jgi:hypothetical protein
MVYKKNGPLRQKSGVGLGKPYSDTKQSITSHDGSLEPTKQQKIINMDKEILQLQCNALIIINVVSGMESGKIPQNLNTKQ